MKYKTEKLSDGTIIHRLIKEEKITTDKDILKALLNGDTIELSKYNINCFLDEDGFLIYDAFDDLDDDIFDMFVGQFPSVLSGWKIIEE